MSCKKWKCQNIDCKEDCYNCVLNTQQVCEDCINFEKCSINTRKKNESVLI